MSRRFKFDKMEFAGAFGDLGILIPFFVGLVAINGMNPAITLLIVGLCYIICGFYYRLPIPVQPMKAMAAIAIASNLNISILSAAGILMGIILLILSVSKLTSFIARAFPLAIVQGIQLGVGLMLIKTSWGLISKPIIINTMPYSNMITLFNGLIIFVGIAIILISVFNKRFPSSILLICFGIIISIFNGKTNEITISIFTMQKFILTIPSLDDFVKAFFLLVIPQFPLTIGNSIVSTKDIAIRYFGSEAKKVTERSLCTSLGITNILAGLVGGIPLCHGSGGLTAHYSFGARSSGAVIIMGSLCLGLALIFGGSASEVFQLIPYSILGIMLFYVGIIHTFLIKNLSDKKEIIIAVGTGITALFSGNLSLAYVVGMVIMIFCYSAMKITHLTNRFF